uniref:Succinate-semialdehyde dehydrogenase, mitochondrial n=1 Tax=Schistocephalus solidus TaxID=70667 RepID=A0A0X3P2J7_SCHSO
MHHCSFRLAKLPILHPLTSNFTTWRSLVPVKKAFIGGEWVTGSSRKTFPVYNPSTEALITEVPALTSTEVNAAVSSAAEAQKTWAAKTAGERAFVIRRWADVLRAQTPLLAELITTENGKVDSDARGEIASAIAALEWYAEEAKRTYGCIIPSTSIPNRRLLVNYQPVGVVAMITPWNFPLSMITRKAGAALAAGCSVVLKPADETPLTALAAAFLATTEAGMDGRLLNVVTVPAGPAGAEMVGNIFCSHPLIRQIGFTGSTQVGKKLYTAAAAHMKRATLELGGNAPFIVFESADLPKAVDQLVASKFRCSGQTCICANRILVQESIYDQFVLLLTESVSKLKFGVHQGPLINKTALNKVSKLVESAISEGAVPTIGGKPVSDDRKGFFYPPSVLRNCTPTMACGREEIFGPVAPIISFRTEDEALEIANSTPYGLAGYMFSRDTAQCWRVAEGLQAGLVGVNSGIVSTPEAPFGGVKQSGIGREGGPHALTEFMDVKYVCWADIN